MRSVSVEVKESKAPVTQQMAKTPNKKFMLVNAFGKIKRDFPTINSLFLQHKSKNLIQDRS